MAVSRAYHALFLSRKMIMLKSVFRTQWDTTIKYITNSVVHSKFSINASCCYYYYLHFKVRAYQLLKWDKQILNYQRRPQRSCVYMDTHTLWKVESGILHIQSEIWPHWLLPLYCQIRKAFCANSTADKDFRLACFNYIYNKCICIHKIINQNDGFLNKSCVKPFPKASFPQRTLWKQSYIFNYSGFFFFFSHLKWINNKIDFFFQVSL